MKRIAATIILIAVIASALLPGCSDIANKQDQEDFRQGQGDPAEPAADTSTQIDTSSLSFGALPGYEKYPRTFSIFIAYANHELPLAWKDVKSFLTDAGYEFWHPVDGDETSGFMLFHNSDDEQEIYYELTLFFGGLSDDGEDVEVLMYQLNPDCDYVAVRFQDGGDKYTIFEYTYGDDGLSSEEWEVSTLDEIISYAVDALDEVYENSYTG